MKQTILSCICFLSILTATHAQKKLNTTTFIYKINANQAKDFYMDQLRKDFESYYFYDLVDSFSTKSYEKKLPQGFFLYVSASNEALKIELNIEQSIFVVPIKEDQDLVLHVIDSLFQPIANAKIRYGRKKIKYNNKTKDYRLKTGKEEGLITIEAQGDTIFYELERDDDIDNWKERWKSMALSQWWKKKKAKWRIKRKNRLPNIGRLKYTKGKGYLSISQPKYRPLDTVKVKAYLASKKAKPLTEPVIFAFFDRRLEYSNAAHKVKPIHTIKVSPSSPGNYTTSFVLSDSLKIDQSYYLYILKSMEGEERICYFQQRFHLEDYELDVVKYSLDMPRHNHEFYLPHEKIIVAVSGKDQNNLFIPDGQVKISLSTNQLSSLYTSTAYIPDFLWEESFQLSSNNITKIVIPWDKLPKAKIGIYLKAEFFNSSGAYEVKTKNFEIDNQSNYIRMDLKDNQLHIDYWENGKNTPINALLTKTFSDYIHDKNPKHTTSIKLPYKKQINSYAELYQVSLKNNFGKSVSDELEVNLSDNSVYCRGYRTRDSVSFSLNNPCAIPVSYYIYIDKKLVKSGATQLKNLIIHEKISHKKSAYLIYYYSWKGGLHHKIANAYYSSERLKIKIEQPKKIIPSESVSVKIKVTDDKNQPVPNTNLTAVAINDAFKQKNIFSYSSTKFQKTKELKGRYENEYYSIDEYANTPYNAKWYKKLNLKQSLYYRVRFPEKGILMEKRIIDSDPFYEKIAQFAPYISQNGRLQAIHLIYCNNELIYFSGTDETKPYSFVGQEGYNTIKIRTKDKEWTIKNVLLTKGQKLELAIDLNSYKNHPLHKNISYQNKPTHFTTFEQKLLNKTILVLQRNYNSNTYIWQNTSNIHYNNSYLGRDIFLGPFSEGAKIHIARKEKYKTDFIFEGGYAYKVKNNKARLYEHHWFIDKKEFPKKTIQKMKVGQLIYPPSFVELKTKQSEIDQLIDELNIQLSIQEKNIEKRAKYNGIVLNPKKIKALVWTQNKRIVRVENNYRNRVTHFPKGDYTLFVYKNDTTYSKLNITLKNDTTFHQYINDETITYQIDPNFQLLKTLLTKALAPENSPENPKLGSGEPKIIKGKITEYGRKTGLIGVNIRVQNRNIGTSTDIDGNYSLLVRDGDSLEVSYLGYKTRTVSTVGMTTINIELNEANNVDEVLITDYGVQKKSHAIGSISRVENVGVLSGKVAGVSSASAPITIRGAGSIYGSNAVVDLDEYERLINNQGLMIRSNFRDNGYWQPNLLTDQNGEVSFQTQFPDNITTWKTKVIGMDQKGRIGFANHKTKSYKPVMGQIVIPRFLVVGDEVEVVGKSLNFTNDTFDITTAFRQNDKIIFNAAHQLSESIIEKMAITANEPTDSLCLQYEFQTANFSDGEKRVIPVIEKGTKENIGQFFLLENDTTLQLSFDPNYGPVAVTVQTDLLEVLLEEIENLKAYPYGCNEQLASKLLALLWKQKIQQQVNQPFKDKKLVFKNLKKLIDTQNDDGSWGWWKDGKANGWISVYIVKVLDLAQKNGYTKANNSYQRGLTYLTNGYHSFNKSTKFQILNFFVDQEIQADFEQKLADFKKERLSDYEALIQIKVQQFAKLPNKLDSLSGAKKHTIFGGTYWGNKGYRWFDNSVPLTLLAYDIYKNAGDEETCKRIRQYFLETRQHSGWRNTYESAQILNRILPDVLATQGFNNNSTLSINNQLIDVKKKRFQAQFSNDDMIIQKSGNQPIYFTAYQQFQNKAPKKKTDIFEITTRFHQNKKTHTKSNIQLQQNEQVKLLTSVEVKESADYLMIEIPIPAGCSYENKNRSWGNYEVHREYFKDRVIIFCERLPVGKYDFSINLESRFTGDFTINPAKIEQMYFPIFYGRNEMKQVKVK